MAKRKKSRDHQESKGQRPNVSRWCRKAAKRDVTSLERLLRQQEVWLEGKNVVLTVPNPNTNETKKPFIRKPAVEVWGRPRKFSFSSAEK